MQEVIFKDLGTQPYKEIWDYQEQLLKQNVDIKAANRELDNEDLKASHYEAYRVMI
jgi:lipoyl(octanoyl) transferase